MMLLPAGGPVGKSHCPAAAAAAAGICFGCHPASGWASPAAAMGTCVFFFFPLTYSSICLSFFFFFLAGSAAGCGGCRLWSR